MSTDWHVFFRGSAEGVRHAVGKRLGVAFVRGVEDGTWQAHLLGVSISLRERHLFVNDGGIDFESYPVALGLHCGPPVDADLRDALCHVLAIMCARSVSRSGIAYAMIIRELAERIEF